MTDWLRSAWAWWLLRVMRRVGVRAALFALVALLAALVAPLLGPDLPEDLAEQIGADAVGDILGILASSMLVVATFSLGTLISAFAVASSSTTPRVTELLMRDSGAQNAISTFVGAFLFSLSGIIGIHSGLYTEDGRVFLFGITLLVVVIVVATFLRWVDLLSHMGRIPDAIDRASKAALEAIEERTGDPFLGGVDGSDTKLPHAVGPGRHVGYVRHVDLGTLQEIASDCDGKLRLEAPPGAFVDPGAVLVYTDFIVDAKCADAIANAFEIGPRRTLDLDPRYGLITIAEIGSKALSTGINDPGTAINVIAALTNVLAHAARVDPEPAEVLHDRVLVPGLDPDDLFEDAFAAIARDGAGLQEVQVRLQKALAVLARLGDDAMAAAALRAARRARDHAVIGLPLAWERERVELLLGAVEAAAQRSAASA